MEPATAAPAAETGTPLPEALEPPTMMLTASELLRLVRIARQLEAAAPPAADASRVPDSDSASCPGNAY